MSQRSMELVDILPNIRRFAVSLAGNLADADDLLQSTVERVLDKGLPQDAPLLPWCLKVCRNIWIDEVRSRTVRSRAHQDPMLAGETAVSGEAQVHGEMTLTEVQDMLLQISEEQRAVLELIAVEGYSYQEAADVLEIPIGTVMSRLARARANLAKQMDAHETSAGANDETS